MKKVITFFGTSIFENYLNYDGDSTFQKYLEDLRDKMFDDYESERNRVGFIKKKLFEWISNCRGKELINISAEIKSISKIWEEIKEDIDIYFTTSDSILSNIAFEVIQENWGRFANISCFNINPTEKQNAVIKDLQIKDRDKFRNGLVNLINKISGISQELWENIIINITAGYKAVIPYLTVLAQVNKCPIYYIFEDTDALIKIPYIPLDINWQVFKENKEFFFDLEVDEIKEIPSNLKLKEEVESLIEKEDNLISLNPLGVILWEKYKSSVYLFKILPIVNDYVERKDQRIKEIFEKSIMELVRRLRSNPNDPDLDHKLSGINFSQGFKTFKHKVENLQIRVLYKIDEYTTRYNSKDFRLYIGCIAIGQDVHNSENEYIEMFKKQSQKIINYEEYFVYKIEHEW